MCLFLRLALSQTIMYVVFLTPHHFNERYPNFGTFSRKFPQKHTVRISFYKNGIFCQIKIKQINTSFRLFLAFCVGFTSPSIKNLNISIFLLKDPSRRYILSSFLALHILQSSCWLFCYCVWTILQSSCTYTVLIYFCTLHILPSLVGIIHYSATFWFSILSNSCIIKRNETLFPWNENWLRNTWGNFCETNRIP
jgi:hypothetical protein